MATITSLSQNAFHSSEIVDDPLKYLTQFSQLFHCELTNEQFAISMDKEDPLSRFRKEFYFPKTDFEDLNATTSAEDDVIYLCGNSLGLQPKSAEKFIHEELEEWRKRAVEAHFHHSKQRPWLTTDEYVLDQLSELIGAQKGEVAVMNSLSVNLHFMLVAFYRPTKERYKILIESKSFPSDLVKTK